MRRFLWIGLAALSAAGWAAEPDEFVSLFNGRDLSGWVNVNCAPVTWTVREGMIHCTGHPTGALRTVRQYENFILELEWRHLTSGGNSGVFIWATPIAAPGVPFLRGIEVQVLDHGFNVPGKNEWYTTHGDVFPIHGATMKPFGRHNGMRSFPSEERSKGFPEWNHYQIVCNHGVIRLHVNGKEVSGGEDCNYRKGYLGLESEGAPIDFRNIRIKELPPSGAAPELTAPQELGWRPLFTGLDLRGWKANTAAEKRWNVKGERMIAAAGPEPEKNVLWTKADFGDAEFVVDCREIQKTDGEAAVAPALEIRGENGKGIEIELADVMSSKFQRWIVTVRGRDVAVQRDGKEVQRVVLPSDAPSKGALGLRPARRGAEFMNLYARDLHAITNVP